MTATAAHTVRRHEPRAALAAGTLVLLLLAAACALAWRDDSPLVPRDGGLGRERDGVALSCSCLRPRSPPTGLRSPACGDARPRCAPLRFSLLAIQLTPLAAPLLLSTDAWTYWAYGWIGTHGGNPYVDAPAFPGNPALAVHGGSVARSTRGVRPGVRARRPSRSRSRRADARTEPPGSPRPCARPAWQPPRCSRLALATRRAFAQRSSAGTRSSRFTSPAAGTTTPGSGPHSPPRSPLQARRPGGAGVSGRWRAGQVGTALLLALRVLEARTNRQRVSFLAFGGTVSVGARAGLLAMRLALGEAIVPLSPATPRSRRATRSRTGSSSSGVPAAVALGLAIAASRSAPCGWPRCAPGPRAARPRGVPGARDDAVPRRLVPGVGVPARRSRGGHPGTDRVCWSSATICCLRRFRSRSAQDRDPLARIPVARRSLKASAYAAAGRTVFAYHLAAEHEDAVLGADDLPATVGAHSFEGAGELRRRAARSR